MLTTNEIRRRFLAYYQQNGHEIVRSSSLVPKDDPSLLFTNSGMVQFKKIFQGLEKRAYTRATTAQKCLRVGGKHNDLENVGRTARHHTFFEMLGNFSFGDYFKEDAIKFAWHFLTKELELPEDKLYATIFLDDDEAEQLWLAHTSIPKERIIRMGEKDNFWRMGDTGPCGPCSEILIDQGEHMTCGPDCGIGKCDCDRFLEIWNLVFMQFNETAPGKREPLPKPSIDTGMGLERVSAVCQGVYSNFDGDLFRQIIVHAADLAGVKYSRSAPDTNDTDTALRVVADHSRAIAFMVADGIMPSNEGRGYVLRRLIRRAYRFGRLIGMPKAFLYKTADNVVDQMGDDFPELRTGREFMVRVIKEEEDRFDKTLDKGLSLLEEEMAGLEKAGQKAVPGAVAFKLYDTYGFPLDIINDVAEKRGFSVDEDGFKICMDEQKKRAKAAWKGSGETDLAARFAALLEDGLHSTFTGYEALSGASRIIALLDAEGSAVPVLPKGAKGFAVAGVTPFYGASGGQVGDTGRMTTPLGAAQVLDTLKASPELTLHQIEVSEGEILLDSEVDLLVEEGARLASARNHTCTHLLHAALQAVLGEHARQAGSLVAPDRLRFDFHHFTAMTPEELAEVERRVNAAILADRPLAAEHMAYDAAVAGGAMALFGEKYADNVRVVRIEGESVELCGGTHLDRTGRAGAFAITSEAGVAAGIRRIEAVTGWNTLELFNTQRHELADLYGLTKSRPGELVHRVAALQEEVRALRRDLAKAEGRAAGAGAAELAAAVETVAGVPVVCAATGAPNMKALRELADDVRSRLASGILCLTAEEDGKAHMIVAVSKDLQTRFNASDLIKIAAAPIDGSGGGRPDLAQAGGANPAGAEAGFAALKTALSV